MWEYRWEAWGEGEEITKTRGAPAPAGASAQIWDLQTQPPVDITCCHSHPSVSLSKKGHSLAPSFSQTYFSSSASHLPTSHPSQSQSSTTPLTLFLHFHIHHLTSPTNFSFELVCSSFSLILALLFTISGLLSCFQCLVSKAIRLIHLHCKSNPARTLPKNPPVSPH